MKFVSTRNTNTAGVSFSEAMLNGLADDGGLYVPKELPKIDLAKYLAEPIDLVSTAIGVLTPFFKDDLLAGELPDIVKKAFNFDIPMRSISDDYSILELFHGPTCAFKDVGARFLAACMGKKHELQPSDEAVLILVATSGDTGGAVAAAFHGVPGVRVAVLFPAGRVSSRQEKQLTVWGDNILSLEVAGPFDQCQELLKEAFLDSRFKKLRVTSANSINIARWLPQTIYFCLASLQTFKAKGEKASFIVPTGNMGNVAACLYAKEMGFPIGNVLLSCNANGFVQEYRTTGEKRPRPSIATLANAMDVGNPSNIERIEYFYGTDLGLPQEIAVAQADDAAIRQAIAHAYKLWGEIICPHTATALHAGELASLDSRPWILVSTAHAAKFNEVVEPIVGCHVEVPSQLQQLLSKPSQSQKIAPDLNQLLAVLSKFN